MVLSRRFFVAAPAIVLASNLMTIRGRVLDVFDAHWNLQWSPFNPRGGGPLILTCEWKGMRLCQIAGTTLIDGKKLEYFSDKHKDLVRMGINRAMDEAWMTCLTRARSMGLV